MLNRFAGTVSVLLNDGTGVFALPVVYPMGKTPWAMTAADFDGDGDIDLAATSDTWLTTQVVLNDGSGVFGGVASYAGVGWQWLTTADPDFDGDGDLVGASAILRSNGDGTFGFPAPLITGPAAQSVAPADLNGDGKVD